MCVDLLETRASRSPGRSGSAPGRRCRPASRAPFAVALLALLVAAADGSAERSGPSGDAPRPKKTSGLLTQGRDGSLHTASAARIAHRAGRVDKIGSFLFGLGYGAPDFESAALSLVRLTPGGALDLAFGTDGSVLTPLPPRRNRDDVTVTAMLEDARGRTIVVGWRTLSSALDANFQVIVAARYSARGELDPSFGEGGIVTTRIGRDDVTQAFAATLDGEGRLLVAGYNGGQDRRRGRMLDDWPVRAILLRYSDDGVLDRSFGVDGIASHVLVPGKAGGSAGREFLYYDYGRTKAAAVSVDPAGRCLVAVASGAGPVVFLRFTRRGDLDPSFGNAGAVETEVGEGAGVSSLLWDSAGRLLAVGTSDKSAVLVRTSADGVLDASFGMGGIQRTPIGEDLRTSAALLDESGHLLVVASGNDGLSLARHDQEGRPDPAFGSNGVVAVGLDGSVATRAGIALDDAGNPVVVAAGAQGLYLVRFDRRGLVERRFLPIPAEPRRGESAKSP